MTDSKDYDNFVLKSHIEQNGCVAPYHMPYAHVPICKTKVEMTSYQYDLFILRGKYTTHPCRGMTNIDWETEELDLPLDSFFPMALQIQIFYPDALKIITQHKEIGTHTFIGNIGAYIGLFLGKTYNQNVHFPCLFLQH